MKQLYVKLQTPIIELPVKAKDSSGAKDSIVIGFKRYKIEESEKLLQDFQELLKNQLEAGEVSDSTEANTFIKSMVVYIKQAKPVIYDSETEKEVELSIMDTRKAKPNEGLWEDADSCLDALLELYLSSAPWRSSLINAMTKALLNVNYEEESLKN